jgi:hypothetical protein
MFALSVRSSVALLLGVTAAPLLSQTIVSGVVRAERGKPIAGAAVQFKGRDRHRRISRRHVVAAWKGQLRPGGRATRGERCGFT